MNDVFIILISFFVGFIAANFIFYSNHPIIIFVMGKMLGNRPSMLKNMFKEDQDYEKRNKVKYQKRN